MSVKRKVNYTNEYAVIVPNSLGMLLMLFTNILINLTIRSFQCEFVSSKKYTIELTIQTWKHLSVDKMKTTGYENKGLQHPMVAMTKLMV
jgi:hypothetical protein